MDFTKQAQFRIGLAKNVMHIIQKKMGLDEEWHIFTFKEDEQNLDLDRFKVMSTRKSILPFGKKMVPVKQRFVIYVREDKESVVVLHINIPGFTMGGIMPLQDFLGQDEYEQTDLSDWMIRFEQKGDRK